MEFLDNKYTRWYFSLIDAAKSKNRKKLRKDNPKWIYYERHHITPKCFGGPDDKSNLVLLTAREHFVAHWLLTKMVGSTRQREQMLNAFGKMMHSNKSIKKDIISGWRYERCRLAFSERNSTFMSRLHKGKTVEKAWNKGLTKETSKSIARMAANPERNEKIRKSKLGVPRSEDLKQKLRERKGKARGGAEKGIKFTKEHKANLKKNHKGMTGLKNPAPLAQCENCGVIFNKRAIDQYHNKKCKQPLSGRYKYTWLLNSYKIYDLDELYEILLR